MNKANISMIKNLIKTDLITAGGGKNNQIFLVSFLFLLFGLGGGFFCSPLFGAVFPLLTGAFLIPTLFNNEIINHSEKMYFVLPVSRRDLVNERFIFSIGLFVLTNLLFYPVMLLSMKLELYLIVSDIDLLNRLKKITGAGSKLEVLNFSYLLCSFLGVFFMSGQLRKYFMDSESVYASMKMKTKNSIRKTVLLFAAFFAAILIYLDILPLSGAVLVLLELVILLSKSNMIGVILFIIACMKVLYSYVCTVIEYEDREL